MFGPERDRTHSVLLHLQGRGAIIMIASAIAVNSCWIKIYANTRAKALIGNFKVELIVVKVEFMRTR